MSNLKVDISIAVDKSAVFDLKDEIVATNMGHKFCSYLYYKVDISESISMLGDGV